MSEGSSSIAVEVGQCGLGVQCKIDIATIVGGWFFRVEADKAAIVFSARIVFNSAGRRGEH